ncbi:hypothetical protein LCGC14_2936530, partial [marine sediment metagenome]
EHIEAVEAQLLDLHWRIHDVSIMPRVRIEDPPDGRAPDGSPAPLRAGAWRRAVR